MIDYISACKSKMAWCKSGTRTRGRRTREPPEILKVGPGILLNFKSGTPGLSWKFESRIPGPPSKFKSGIVISEIQKWDLYETKQFRLYDIPLA